MVVFRCTRRLAKRFNLRLTDDVSPPASVLGDWYANLLNVGHSRLVLCLSERSLLPVLLPARKREFPERFSDYLIPVLEHLGLPRGIVESEARLSREALLAPTRSRRILGALNDFAANAVFLLRDAVPPCSPFEAALRLSEMPSKPLDFGCPNRVARSLLSRAARP